MPEQTAGCANYRKQDTAQHGEEKSCRNSLRGEQDGAPECFGTDELPQCITYLKRGGKQDAGSNGVAAVLPYNQPEQNHGGGYDVFIFTKPGNTHGTPYFASRYSVVNCSSESGRA